MTSFMVGCSHTQGDQPTGLVVRIARIGRCGESPRDVVLEVRPGGRLRLNGEDQERQELGRRLEDIFRTRFYRYLFIMGDPNVPFGEVPTVLDVAAAKVDYVAILTPSVARMVTGREEACLDPNLPAGYHGHVPL